MNHKLVILVNPAYTLDPAGGFHRTDVDATRQKGLFTRLPLLGLAYLAAPLERRGFAVSIRDASPCGIPEREILDQVRRERPAVVGVSVFSPQLQSAYSLLTKLQDLRAGPGEPFHIVVGGPHISTDPAFAAAMPADFGLAGDAEQSLTQLCRHLSGEAELPLEQIPGLVHRRNGEVNGEVIVNPSAPPALLDEIPWPAHHLLELDRYKSGWGAGRVTAVLGTRGCPYRCAFCGTQDTQPYRERDPADIADELAHVEGALGVSFVELNDELFTYDRARVHALCGEIRSRGLRLRWGCQTRADYVDREVVRAMAEAGCARISFGIESGVREIRRGVGKDISDEAATAAFRTCREAGIDSCALMMIGLPGETHSDVEASIRFAADNATISVFQIHRITPETPIYKRLARQGRIPETLWSEFMRGEAEFPYYVPEGLTLEYLVASLKRAYRSFYFRPAYIWYRLRRVRSPREVWNLARIAVIILRDIVLGGRVRGGQIAEGDRSTDRSAGASGTAVESL